MTSGTLCAIAGIELPEPLKVGDLVTHARGHWADTFRISEIIDGSELLAKLAFPETGEWGGFWRVSELRKAPNV